MSIRPLAWHVGVSLRAPYAHFPDREALLSALGAEGFRAFAAALKPAAATAMAGRETESQAMTYVRFTPAAPVRFQLVFGSRRLDPEGELAAAKDAVIGILRQQVASGTATGGEAFSIGCWALVHGLAVLLPDCRVQEELGGDEDAIVKRVAAALLCQFEKHS